MVLDFQEAYLIVRPSMPVRKARIFRYLQRQSCIHYTPSSSPEMRIKRFIALRKGLRLLAATSTDCVGSSSLPPLMIAIQARLEPCVIMAKSKSGSGSSRILYVEE